MEKSGYGGGLYYTCQAALKCYVVFSGVNSFTNHYAENSGGAVKWDDLEPNSVSDSYFHNNTAYLYGNNIGSFA